jgi:hypothetical protein
MTARNRTGISAKIRRHGQRALFNGCGAWALPNTGCTFRLRRRDCGQCEYRKPQAKVNLAVELSTKRR